MAVVRSLELKSIQLTTPQDGVRLGKGQPLAGTFKPTEDTKPVQVDPEDEGKTVQIGAGLTDK
jgi:hypothetical protein